MRIQLANYQYTGSYAKIRNAGIKAFPYSVKVEGFGTSKTKGSFFDFASVSITEHFEKDKYGTGIINGPRLHPKTSGCKKEGNYSKVQQEKIDAVELPAEFDKFKDDHRFYYHGEDISDYDLIKTAVASGKLELPENITKGSISTLSNEAFKVLVQDEAKPKYPGSTTLYSEDTVLAKGFASASQYYGVFYSVDDVPVSFQNSNVSLVPIADDVWEWKEAGDNRGLVKKIEDNWYYFEASF